MIEVVYSGHRLYGGDECHFMDGWKHRLQTTREQIAFTARPKIQSQSQIFRCGGSIFCLSHRSNFSDIFDLCLHWVSVVRALDVHMNQVCTVTNNTGFPFCLDIDLAAG